MGNHMVPPEHINWATQRFSSKFILNKYKNGDEAYIALCYDMILA